MHGDCAARSLCPGRARWGAIVHNLAYGVRDPQGTVMTCRPPFMAENGPT